MSCEFDAHDCRHSVSCGIQLQYDWAPQCVASVKMEHCGRQNRFVTSQVQRLSAAQLEKLMYDWHAVVQLPLASIQAELDEQLVAESKLHAGPHTPVALLNTHWASSWQFSLCLP
jgi:hypothetical protein